jgi:phage tail sheath protein FI
MPEYMAPGVYVEETGFRGKAIEGVGTSTTAFVGPTRKGPIASPERLPEVLTSWADFERIHGGYADLQLEGESTANERSLNFMAHAVRAFFNEGGSRLVVARVYLARGDVDGTASTIDLRRAAASPGIGETQRIRFAARFPGRCGNGALPTLAQPALRGIQARELVVSAPQHVLDSVPAGSLARTGHTGAFAYFLKRAGGWFPMADSGTVASDAAVLANASLITLAVITTDADGASVAFDGLGYDAAHPRFVGAVMSPTPTRQAGQVEPLYALELGSGVNARHLLDALFPDEQNPAAARADGRRGSFALNGGDDGEMPTASAYTAAFSALAELDDISIVAAPGSSSYKAGEAIRQALITHAEGHRMYRFAVLDTNAGLGASDAREARVAIDSKYAALYYPWVVTANPNARPGHPDTPREIALPPSGFICGIYARADRERGVFKAPANEVVRGALRFEREVSLAEQERLNPLGVNCLRFFPGRGCRVWGARTVSSDPEWKYVNVRRFVNYLQASIDRGTQWAVFEPNGEQLWTRLRETIAAFLYNEWSKGALLGRKTEEAYFVRCDRSTMTQDDLDKGRLVCLIGVALQKPAEFVTFRIGQKTADSPD